MSELLRQPDFNEGVLSEADHLNRLRLPDGSHSRFALDGVNQNLVPAAKEAAMPLAVSTTYQGYHDGNYWWLDQTPDDVARSGYRFHSHPAALERVPVEIDEAISLANLRPGYIKTTLSPKMSPKDAPYAIAKQEHLGDDDMIRIHMVDMGEDGVPRGKYMQSILVRHIPLKAWVRMLADPNNIFGRAIQVEDPESALSVMKVHRQLEVPEAGLPEGVVSILEAVLPYVDEPERAKVAEQLQLFRCGQDELHRKAQNIAARWLGFEVALADSLYLGYATDEVQDFIRSLAFEWNEEMANEIMENTESDGRIRMTRSLAAKLETSRRNTLWVSAAVITQNKRVVQQLSPEAAQQIYVNEMFIQTMMQGGSSSREIRQIEAENNKVVAGQNAEAGGGCPGTGTGLFGSPGPKKSDSERASAVCPEVRNGQSVKCPGCKETVKAIVPNKEKIYCSNPSCKLAAPHLKSKKSHMETPKTPRLSRQVGGKVLALAP